MGRCVWCDTEFNYNNNRIKYCSDYCKSRAHNYRIREARAQRKGHNGYKPGDTPFDKVYDKYMRETNGSMSYGIWSASRGVK